jgi:oligosaccharide repeat unit polymerase
MKIKKSSAIAYVLLLMCSVTYFFVVVSNVENVWTYLIELIMLVLTVILFNRDSLVSANVLFVIYYCYTVALGPLFLLTEKIDYGYSYFSVILGSLLAFLWGNATFSNKRFNRPIEDKGIIRINLSRKSALRILYAISFLASIYFLIKNRSLILGGNLVASRLDAISGSGAILYISQLTILIVPMMYDLYFYGKKNKIRTISKEELISLAVLACGTLLFSGFRAPVMSMAICLIVLIIQKNNIKNTHIIYMGALLVILVEILGMTRNMMSGVVNKGFIATMQTSLIVNAINLKYVFNTFPSRVPFQRGYTYLINLLMLMPGPDQDFTLWLKDQIGISFAGGGVTPTIMGEFYINFGIVGMYIGMFILGATGVYIYRYFKKHSNTFLGVFYVWQFAHCASGGIANVMITVILYTIVYWGIMMCPIYKSKGNR